MILNIFCPIWNQERIMQTSTSSENMTIKTDISDAVIGFYIPELNVRGRFIRLQKVLSDIVQMHDYPPQISQLLGENLLLAGLLGTTLKFQGRLTLQLQGDGPLRFVVTDFKTPDGLRGCVTFGDGFDAENITNSIAETAASSIALMGNGQLIFTIDQGQNMHNYQGIVPLEGGSLAQAAEAYFCRSEQLPTALHLAMVDYKNPASPDIHFAGGGMILQYLPVEEKEGDATQSAFESEGWVTAKALADTLQIDELTDPILHPHEILYRLFHEYDVEVFPALPLQRFCQCSYEKCLDLLSQFPKEDIKDMTTQTGYIDIKCDFCSSAHSFKADDILSSII